jgi:hypothetical protein
MTQKLLIGLGLVLIAGCALTVALAQRLTDANRVTVIAQRMADFELPAGFQPDYAVEMMGYTIAAYQSNDGNGHLALLQAPSGVLPEEQAVQGYLVNEPTNATWSQVTPVLTDERMVRGHSATLTISDRTNGEGVRYRSLNMLFEGREGMVLLVINLPLAQWNDALIETFINSIR